jgi:hypothetical protein
MRLPKTLEDAVVEEWGGGPHYVSSLPTRECREALKLVIAIYGATGGEGPEWERAKAEILRAVSLEESA